MNHYKRICFLVSVLLFLFSAPPPVFSRQTNEEMVFIPPGTYFVGTDDPEEDSLLEAGPAEVLGINLSDSTPKTPLYSQGFYMDTFEVTNEKYKTYTQATGYPSPPHWKNQAFPTGEEKFPVTNITWFDGKNYCAWAKKRLPIEEEWEVDARGEKRYLYPWGNTFDKTKSNLNAGKAFKTGSFPDDKSSFGVYDMEGNVTEWTDSWYKAYSGNPEYSNR